MVKTFAFHDGSTVSKPVASSCATDVNEQLMATQPLPPGTCLVTFFSFGLLSLSRLILSLSCTLARCLLCDFLSSGVYSVDCVCVNETFIIYQKYFVRCATPSNFFWVRSGFRILRFRITTFFFFLLFHYQIDIT